MEHYFAYGSNMSTARLQARVAAARPLGCVFVDGWQLCFDKPGRDGTGKANLTPAIAARVWGVLFEVPIDAWESLDRFEPGYERSVFRFTRQSGEPVEAQGYVYPARGPGDAKPGRVIEPPSAEYLAHLLAGAREHGLPDPHIAWIESFGR